MPDARPATAAPAPATRRPALRSLPAAAAGPAAARELWLALDFPRLPLDALAAVVEGARATVVAEADDPRRTVVACNDRAARQGIAPGMGLTAALARVPGLKLLERRPADEAALLERLARWTFRFTPVVSLEPPRALLAEVRGSLGLFGGAEALLARVAGELAGGGLQVRAALAPTPRGALWLARAGIWVPAPGADAMPALAARLPLGCLHWPAEVVAELAAVGARTVADLARLPRDGFAARYGPERLDELDRGLGRRREPRRRHVAPERFDERLELPAETGSVAGLQPSLEKLLAELGAFLRRRAAGLVALRIDLLHRGQPPTRIRLGLARAAGDAAHLRELVRERLAQGRLAAPVAALRLRSGPLRALTPRDPRLIERGCREDPEATARLLDRLRARLGCEAVFGVRTVPEHRPERAWRVAEPGGADDRPADGESPRPLWMLAEPQPFDEREAAILAGPERIESGWWDGHDVRRDYYVALTPAGVRLWIFRERPPGQRWFLHGIFG